MPSSLHRLAVVTVLCIASGCAVLNSRAPEANYKPSAPPRCSTAGGSVAADVMMGILWSAVGIGAMADGEGAGALALLGGAGFLGSAAAGISWGNKCKKQHQEHANWLSRREDRIEERVAIRRRARILRERARRIKASMERDKKAEQPKSPYGDPPPRPSPTNVGEVSKSKATSAATVPSPPAGGRARVGGTKHTRSWPSGDWSEFWREVNR